MLRCDQGKIQKYDTMPNGMLRVWGTIAKVGWLKYNTDKGEQLEYVDEGTLFAKAHVDSIAGATLTLLHPSEPVTPKNYKQYTVGSTGTKVVKREDLGTIEIVTVIADEEAINAVKNDAATELSMGYNCDTALIEGNRYRQLNRICNHNAIVPRARARGARLHLDGYLQSEFINLDSETKNNPDSKIEAVNKGRLLSVFVSY